MEQQNELPKQMPIDMAMAPDQNPYEHAHVIHTTAKNKNENKLAQHSLSPEKLGVTGYVKDVAGFVKDLVHERRARRSSASSTSSASDKPMIEQEAADNTGSSSSTAAAAAQHTLPQQQSSPLVGAVTGLFPGVGSSNENAAGCTHADDLRNQMMHINNEDNSRKLL